MKSTATKQHKVKNRQNIVTYQFPVFQFNRGDPDSEPQTDAYVDIVSSFDIATKFSGVVDNLLVSLKYPFWRPE